MAGSLNKVTLIGRVGKDPAVRSFNDGNRMATFSLATSESWKDKGTGERKEKSEWHNIVVTGALVGTVEQYVKKGMLLYVEGQLRTRKYQDQSGAEKYSTEITLGGFNGSIQMLSRADEAGGSRPDHQAPSGYSAPAKAAPAKAAPKMIDDEIPF
jgi:single-strand DNA-binding protein